MAPGDLDTYWSGTAPICMGGCKGKHKELKRSQCGNGSCCWLGYKSFCRGTATQGLWECMGQVWFPFPSTRVPSSCLPMGTSPSPVNCGRPEADFNSVVHGNDWWVGSVVRYSCRPGFMLLGDPASACQSDGHWTPKPTCLREYSGVGWLLLSQQPTVGEKGAGGYTGGVLQTCSCRDLPARPDRDQRAGHQRELLVVLQHPEPPGSLPAPRLHQDLLLQHQTLGLGALVPALRRLRVRLPRALRGDPVAAPTSGEGLMLPLGKGWLQAGGC